MNTLTNCWRAGRVIAPAVATLGLAACATTGTGVGNTRNNDVSASFAWQSTNDRTGTLTASLSNGKTYSGEFFQITSESRIDQLGPLWYGWHAGWRGWSYWDAQPSQAFVTHYSGRVVANLDASDATHMRCRFQLVTPTDGMAGGGEGKCQLPSGQEINATFARS